MPDLATYRAKWVGWVCDPLLATHGLTFDRTPAGRIIAPKGVVRVCAWHSDFDERPTCFLDVATIDEALAICADLSAACAWNVDFATAHDDAGEVLVSAPY